jgi:hypothetical protein
MCTHGHMHTPPMPRTCADTHIHTRAYPTHPLHRPPGYPPRLQPAVDSQSFLRGNAKGSTFEVCRVHQDFSNRKAHDASLKQHSHGWHATRTNLTKSFFNARCPFAGVKSTQRTSLYSGLKSLYTLHSQPRRTDCLSASSPCISNHEQTLLWLSHRNEGQGKTH